MVVSRHPGHIIMLLEPATGLTAANDRFNLSASLSLVYWQWTHGGIDVPVPPSNPLFPYHDQLAAEEYFNVGAGSSWIVNDRVSVYGLYMHALSGKNGHKLEHRVSLGVSYGLGGH